MNKHTLGPWEVARGHVFENNKPITTELFVRVPGDDVAIAADIVNPAGELMVDEVAEANARLIAAAPDMLAALEAVNQGFADGTIRFTKKRESDSEPYHPANTLICAAIAKARGDDEQ